MNLEELDTPAVEQAVEDAIAVLCQGLPGQASGAKPNPGAAEPAAPKRLAELLRRARNSQAAIVARAYSRSLSVADADFYGPRGRDAYEVGQRAANELVAQLQRSGRALQGRDDIGSLARADSRLLELLVSLAVASQDEGRGFKGELYKMLSPAPKPAEVGPFLSAFIELAPRAIESEDLLGPADNLTPRLVPRLTKAFADEPFVREWSHVSSVPLPEVVGHTLRAGARRIAFLSGIRTRP